jgi:signal peptidase I
MTASSTTASLPDKAKSPSEHHPQLVVRETLESFAVALILAFMFRAFVAEIFVIPTGSMAPTLMGAHKDVKSEETGFQYPCGASQEFETETGRLAYSTVVGTTCPLSRRMELLDLENRPNHTTFSGDRIIVSKFSYLWNPPKRWDVIVFKYPLGARMNYIKRCVGLPNETVRIQHGDIYTRPEGSDQFAIARKPPHVVQAMLQAVADTSFLGQRELAAHIPDAWQPSPDLGRGNLGWELTKDDATYANGWQVAASDQQWTATFEPQVAAAGPGWLRYHHRILSPLQWELLEKQGALPAPIPPHSSRLISDFTAYNAAIWKNRTRVYDPRKRLLGDYRENFSPTNLFAGGFSGNPHGSTALDTDGRHWTGDLAAEFQLEIGAGSGTVTLDLVEAGIHYLCQINVADGQGALMALRDGKKQAIFESDNGERVESPTAATGLRANSQARLKFANVDNTLHLWVNGRLVEFTPSNRVASDDAARISQHQPQATPEDPLDAAPVGLGVQGVAVKATRARVWRDIYYIAAKSASGLDPIVDDPQFDFHVRQSLSDQDIRRFRELFYPGLPADQFGLFKSDQRDIFFSTPSLWNGSPVFANRRTVEFSLGQDDFFPMGDNSAASADARSWGGRTLPRDLLIGRAISVFWPHFWMEPIPYLPNFARMGLIR